MEERTSPSEPVTVRVRDLDAYLDRGLEVPVAQREAWLLAAESSKRFASFLNEPLTPAPPAHAASGELIGSFRVVRELGQGGMAVVYAGNPILYAAVCRWMHSA